MIKILVKSVVKTVFSISKVMSGVGFNFALLHLKRALKSPTKNGLSAE